MTRAIRLLPLLGLVSVTACDEEAGAGGSPSTTASATSATGTTTRAATSSTTTTATSTTAAATSATGGTGGAPGCTAMLCEDFEAGPELDPRWTVALGYDPAHTLGVETGQVASGQFALHAHIDRANGGFAQIREAETFPALADELWGRAWFRASIASETGHSGFVWAAAGDANVLEIGYGNGNFQLTWYPEPGAENPAGYDVAVPRDTWVCMEWHFDRLQAPQIEVFIDGDLAVDYARDGASIPAFTELRLGLDNHGATVSDNDVWLDDIAVSSTRIGCP